MSALLWLHCLNFRTSKAVPRVESGSCCADCINLDTNEEAHAHLSATGVLSQHSLPAPSQYASGPLAPVSGSSIVPPLSGGSTHRTGSAAPASNTPRVSGLPTAPQPLSPPAAALVPQSPTPPAAQDAPEPRTTSTSRYKMRALAEGRERPDGSQDEWSTSSVNWAGMDDMGGVDDAEDDVGSVRSAASAGGYSRGGSRVLGHSGVGSHAAAARPVRRHPAGVGHGTIGTTPPQSPLATLAAQQHGRSAPSKPRRGDPSGPLPQMPLNASGPVFPVLDASPSHGGINPMDVSMSIDICPSHPATPGPGGGSQSQVLGYPTLSSPLEPGPYHKANAQLRRQLPHLNVDVTVVTRWDHIILTLFAFFVFLGYIGVRLYYLISGITATYTEQNINVPYSYLVLSAEFFLGALGFYGHQMYWKQEVAFSPMDSVTLRSVSEVRPLVFHAARTASRAVPT